MVVIYKVLMRVYLKCRAHIKKPNLTENYTSQINNLLLNAGGSVLRLRLRADSLCKNSCKRMPAKVIQGCPTKVGAELIIAILCSVLTFWGIGKNLC